MEFIILEIGVMSTTWTRSQELIIIQFIAWLKWIKDEKENKIHSNLILQTEL
jgi:hypothetical protein